MSDKTERISIRVTADEKRSIRNKAKAANLSVTDYLVFSALSVCDNTDKSQTSFAMNQQLVAVKRAAVPILAQLRRVGNNLNQLARRQNAGCQISKTDLDANIEEVIRICRFLKQ